MNWKPIKTDPKLLALLEAATKIEVTEEMLQAQRESWVRANTPTGDPRFD